MKTRIIIALSILCVNFPDGISQGFGKKSGNTNVSHYNNSQTEAKRISGNGFTGIFNSVYFPGTGAGSPVINSQTCTSKISGIYESSENRANGIHERTETLTDSTQSSFTIIKNEEVRNNVVKRKTNRWRRRENKL